MIVEVLDCAKPQEGPARLLPAVPCRPACLLAPPRCTGTTACLRGLPARAACRPACSPPPPSLFAAPPLCLPQVRLGFPASQWVTVYNKHQPMKQR